MTLLTAVAAGWLAIRGEHVMWHGLGFVLVLPDRFWRRVPLRSGPDHTPADRLSSVLRAPKLVIGFARPRDGVV